MTPYTASDYPTVEAFGPRYPELPAVVLPGPQQPTPVFDPVVVDQVVS